MSDDPQVLYIAQLDFGWDQITDAYLSDERGSVLAIFLEMRGSGRSVALVEDGLGAWAVWELSNRFWDDL